MEIGDFTNDKPVERTQQKWTSQILWILDLSDIEYRAYYIQRNKSQA